MGSPSSAAGLRAYRVKRKLLGQTGAPTVTVTQEFWRYKQWARTAERAELTAYIRGRQRLERGFGADKQWAQAIVVTRGGLIRAGVLSKPVGRVFRDAVVLHRKRAPRWLLNWAKDHANVYVLGGITRRTLRAELVRRKLTEKAHNELF